MTAGLALLPNQSSPSSGANISRVERDEGDDLLDLEKFDLGLISEALEDHSPDHIWWVDPRTGDAEPWSRSSLDDEGDDGPEARGLIPIEALPSSESYGDLEEFVSRVRDHRARDLLERAISGRGAFRRFKDTLFEFPDLRDAWFTFHDGRMERRALEWLLEEGLVERGGAERAIQDREAVELPEPANRFDAREVAREAADALGRVYGDRLRGVLLFGSWARGDAHPESDIDLLVVLDQVESVWDELRRMDEVLWRHSFENDTVISAVPVAEADLERHATPVLIRARTEGQVVA
jgi:predicted nucleotidyltransferase